MHRSVFARSKLNTECVQTRIPCGDIAKKYTLVFK